MATSETSISGSGKEESTEQPKLEETESVLVTFVRDDDGSSKLVKDVQLSDSVRGMKLFISSQWNGPTDDIAISYVGETLSSNTTVEQLGATPGQAIELQVHLPPPISVDPHPHDAAVSSAHGGGGGEGGGGGGVYDMGRSSSSTEGMYRLPGSIIVEVKADHGMKEVLVNVEQSRIKKPFLGGYRHKDTGIEYHHASSQTIPKRRPDNDMAKFDRDTQTVKTRNAYQQVMVDATTQMDRTGCFISDRMDMILFPGPYETADEYHAKLLEKVIVLQSYWRRWLGKRYVEDLRIEKKRRAEWERAEALRREREREERRKREFERRMNPHSKEDFELLYHALEMWRQEELDRINQTTSGAERKAALCMLLEQEAHLIASIGKHKISAKEDMREDQIRKFLDTVAAPKKWIAFDGTITEMDTPHTLRACQLRDLYNSITMKGLSSEERLDVLLTLKATVREHDCKLTREIVELVDREADLIVREMKESTLEGLRRRIATLFLQYCKTPLFNAEAAKHIKVPQDPSTLRTHVYYCRSCSQYLPSTDFELSTNSRVIGHCRRCKELDNQARAREDFTLYRAMMKTIRRMEEEYKDGSHFIFLMQEPDLRYLVENIWGCQSVLSGEKDLFELMMVRWNCSKPWSPWNCVLLTKPEAQGHTKLDSAEKAYGAQFVQKVHHRHVLARNYFSRVPGMMEKMEEKVSEMPLPRPKERVLLVPWRRDVNQTDRSQSGSKTVTPVVDPV